MKKTFISAAALLIACGPPRSVSNDAPYQAYETGQSTAIGTNDGGGTVSVTASDPNGCLEVIDGNCVKPDRTGPYCSDNAQTGPVDVITVDGEEVATICYPSPEESKSPVVVATADQVLEVAKTANGTAITFDPATDGKPIIGPVTLSANNVSLYGNGPDKTIIEGDLIIEKNGTRVRGVRVKGNLVVKFNDVSIVLSQIDGNLMSDKNNGMFASNTVLGNIELSGNNDAVYYNKVTGTITGGAECAHNEDENGEALACEP